MRFLADRMAILMVDLVRRDMDYGTFCHDEYYKSDDVRQSTEYEVCIDFIRKMIRRHDAAIANAINAKEAKG